MDPSDNAVVDPGSLGAAMTEQRGPTPAREPPGGEGVSIVVPTYREAGNLRPLAARVSAVMRKARVPWELVLVDDASGDGSEAITAELGRALPVRMVVRRAARPDLSLSVLAGFRAARFDRLVVMDADLSHPAESIPALLAAAQPGTLAIGSRYAAGGSVDAVWSRWRRLNSRVATLLARPLAGGSDPLAGFFAVERASLPELDRLRPVGFKIALEIAVRGRLAVHDVPIAFRDRQRGVSKMMWRAQADFLRHLHRLYLARFGRAARLASFALVGASGFALDVAGYLGLRALGLDHRLARFASFWPAVTWNWHLNRRTTFAERPRRPPGRQWAEFATGSLLGLTANVGGYTALTASVAWFAEHRLLALVTGVALGSVVNYLVANRVVYARRGRGSAG